MYKITKNGSVLSFTDSPVWVKKHAKGFYIVSEEKDATGISVNGSFYSLREGSIPGLEPVSVSKIDSGAFTEQVIELGKQAADTDEMTVDHEYRLTLLELGLTE